MYRKLTVFILITALAVCCAFGALASSFTDVKDPSWYSSSVDYVVEHGYMEGVGNHLFAPNTLVTRAQLTQILYAAESKPEVDSVSPFTDVPSIGKWYSSAVIWGAKEKLVAGYPDKSFRPNQAVTREQLVSVMYKYAQFKNFEKASDGGAMGLAGYPDEDQIASYARPAMLWAVQKGIISGTNIGLEPKGPATRAQMAVIIRAFMTKYSDAEPSEGEDDSPAPSEKPAPSTDPAPSISPNPSEEDETPITPSEKDPKEDETVTPSPAPSSENTDTAEPVTPSPSGSGDSSNLDDDETPIIPG